MSDPGWPSIVKHLRVLRSWSQQTLSEHIDCTAQVVSRWERGLATPHKVFQKRIVALIEKAQSAK